MFTFAVHRPRPTTAEIIPPRYAASKLQINYKTFQTHLYIAAPDNRRGAESVVDSSSYFNHVFIMSTHTDQAKLDFAISLFSHVALSGAYNISTGATGSAYANLYMAADADKFLLIN